MQKGNTTRLVDRYIQELFTKGITHIYEGRNTEKATELTEKCFEIFKKRMLSEHEEVNYCWKYSLIDRIWCYKAELLE